MRPEDSYAASTPWPEYNSPSMYTAALMSMLDVYREAAGLDVKVANADVAQLPPPVDGGGEGEANGGDEGMVNEGGGDNELTCRNVGNIVLPKLSPSANVVMASLLYEETSYTLQSASSKTYETELTSSSLPNTRKEKSDPLLSTQNPTGGGACEHPSGQ